MRQRALASRLDENLRTPTLIMPKKGAQRRTSRSTPEVNIKRSSPEDIEVPTPASHDRDEKPRKKRARKTEQKSPTEVPNENTPVTNETKDSNDAPQTQRMRVMERNRIAATKCRTRKRSEASTLASCEQEMEDQHRQLTAIYDSLKHERLVLKTQLLLHTHCGCVLIQRYIANDAKELVDRMDRMTGETGTPLHIPGSSVLSTGAPVISPGAVITPGAPSAPGLTTSSSMAGSLQTQSPMTSGSGEVMESPYAKRFSGGDSGGSVPTPMMNGYQMPGMAPYDQGMTDGQMGAYDMGHSDLINAQYAQQHQHLDYTNNIAWSPGWQTG